MFGRAASAIVVHDASRSLRKRKKRKKTEDENLKQKKGTPVKVKKAAKVIHKFGKKTGYFPNL
jgi:hypothetical protein